jgi:hypothetical protein
MSDDVEVHPRVFAELALHRGPRVEPEQVFQPDGVAGPHGHVGVGAVAGDVVALLLRAAPLDAALGQPGVGRDVGLDADHRDHLGGGGLLVEVVGAVHVAVVGDRRGRHAEPLGLGQQLLDPGSSVEHRILGVHVEMHERVRHPGPP